MTVALNTEDLQAQERAGRRVTWVGVGANGALIALKLAGGIFGHSQALVADAVHSMSDFFTDAVVLFGLHFGRKPADADHPHGHGRIETAAAVVIGLSLITVALVLGRQAVLDIYHHAENHPNLLAVGGAAASIVVKEVLYHYTLFVGRRIRSPAVVANAWHHRSDALSSVAVLLGVTAALIEPRWHILDAVAAAVVALFIARVGFKVGWAALCELVDTAPDAEVVERIAGFVLEVEGVRDSHDVRIRTVGGLLHVQVHVVVAGDLTVREGHRIADDVTARLERCDEPIGDVTVHVDPED